MSKCTECNEYDKEKFYCQKWCEVIKETIEDARTDERQKFAEKIKSDIEKYWYQSELDMCAGNVNSLIDSILEEQLKDKKGGAENG